jgi:hypothetical protein
MRFVLLLVVASTLAGACGPQSPQRPREGAPVGVAGRPAVGDDRSGVPPTLSPAQASGQQAEQAPSGAQPDSSPSPAPSPSPEPLGIGVIVATDGAGANLRAGPSTTAPVITTVAEGSTVEILGEPVSVEGRLWRQIRSGGREGWVLAVVVRPR